MSTPWKSRQTLQWRRLCRHWALSEQICECQPVRTARFSQMAWSPAACFAYNGVRDSPGISWKWGNFPTSAQDVSWQSGSWNGSPSCCSSGTWWKRRQQRETSQWTQTCLPCHLQTRRRRHVCQMSPQRQKGFCLVARNAVCWSQAAWPVTQPRQWNTWWKHSPSFSSQRIRHGSSVR